ncbi:MAG: lipid-A-disaccharide synthase [Holosporaceae bacterium]|nr:lipid-A-disaccharide synthase [Holosporaceae bacterium]
MKKIFIVAGEASGDYIGGRLMQDINYLDKDVKFCGIGGDCMKAAGLKTLFPVEELSVIGICEVIGKIFRINRLINKTVAAILRYKPQIVVTIDSSGFTHRVNRRLKKHFAHESSSLRSVQRSPFIIHYVAPPVWAWRSWRAKNMGKFIDKLLTLFPFEPPLFSKFALKTEFVGHPIVGDTDFIKPHPNKLGEFQKNILKSAGGPVICLLPGSRMSEIERHMPILRNFVRFMTAKYADVKFIISTIAPLVNEIKKYTKSWVTSPLVIAEKHEKVLALYSSDIAVAASGTVTLELANTNVPFIVIYKTSVITYILVKFLIKINRVCLINILANNDVVPELLQWQCTAENIFQHVCGLLQNASAVERQRRSFQKVMDCLCQKNPRHAAVEVLSSVGWYGKF